MTTHMSPQCSFYMGLGMAPAAHYVFWKSCVRCREYFWADFPHPYLSLCCAHVPLVPISPSLLSALPPPNLTQV